MANAIRRGKVWQYEISYKKPDGKYAKKRKSGYRTKKEALRAGQEMELELQQGENHKHQDMLLADYFEQWMELYKKPLVSEITYRQYVTTQKTIAKLFPMTTLNSLTKSEYQSVLNQYAQTHVKDTVRKLDIRIKACLEEAVEAKIINNNPARKSVVTGNNHSKPSSEKYINYTDLNKLIDHLLKYATHSSHHILLIAALTGARFSEILGLTWDCVNLEAKTITINKTWLYKLTTPTFAPTKNGENRTIAISQKLAQFLADLPRNGERVINIPVTPEAVNKSLSAQLKHLKITPIITCHGLRHSHASALLLHNVNILSIAERLGHKDVSVTQNTYAHIVKELRAKDQDLINSIF